MFEFMKIINETRYRSKAFEQLWKQFPELEEIDPNPLRDHGKSDVSRKLRNHMLWLNM